MQIQVWGQVLSSLYLGTKKWRRKGGQDLNPVSTHFFSDDPSLPWTSQCDCKKFCLVFFACPPSSPPPSLSQPDHFGHVAQVTRCTVKLRWYLDLVSLFRQSGCSFSNENAPLVESATKWLWTVYTAATTVLILHHTFHTVLCFTLIPRRLQSLSPSFSRLGLHSHCDTFQNQLNPDRCTITSSTRVLVSSLLSPVLNGWH